MIDNIKIVELDCEIKLHMIQSNKFKTDLFGVYIKRPLDESEVAMNALITRLAQRGTMQYADSLDFSKKMEDLYGAIFVGDVHKYGEKQVLQYKMNVINHKRVQDDALLGEAFSMFRDILFNPIAKDGAYQEDYFQQEVNNLKHEIISRSNDKMIYAVERCVENMCQNEPFRIHEYGTVDALEHLNATQVYDHFQNILRTSPIDICIIGDIDFDVTEKMVREHLTFERGDIVKVPREVVDYPVESVRYFEETFKVNQGKLSIGYRTYIPFEHPLYSASLVFSTIFGGGGSSKLFSNIREKESLCYYIFARLDKFKSIMLVSSGIEVENYERVVEGINREFNAMLAGDFTDEDIDVAKKSITSSLKSISDFPNSFINYYYNQSISTRDFDMNALIERINGVTREEILEAGRCFKQDTISFIRDEREDETNEDS